MSVTDQPVLPAVPVAEAAGEATMRAGRRCWWLGRAQGSWSWAEMLVARARAGVVELSGDVGGSGARRGRGAER